jgi:propionyl-CoA carboxylase alpha chain
VARGRDGYQVDGIEVISTRAISTRAVSTRAVSTGAVSTGATATSAGEAGWAVTLEVDGVRTTYTVAISGNTVDVDSPAGHLRLTVVPRFTDPADLLASGSLLAPMPGTVVSVLAQAGQQVEAGQPVLVLEAMKMQHTVSAPQAGTVTDLAVTAGQQVAANDVLAVVATDDESQGAPA